MYINPKRPMDSALAETGNGLHLRRMVDRAHVGDSLVQVCRQVRQGFRQGAMAAFPPAVRRAVWLVVANQHAENCELYRRVILGR